MALIWLGVRGWSDLRKFRYKNKSASHLVSASPWILRGLVWKGGFLKAKRRSLRFLRVVTGFGQKKTFLGWGLGLMLLWSVWLEFKTHHQKLIKTYWRGNIRLAQKPFFIITIIILIKQKHYQQFILRKKEKKILLGINNIHLITLLILLRDFFYQNTIYLQKTPGI